MHMRITNMCVSGTHVMLLSHVSASWKHFSPPRNNTHHNTSPSHHASRISNSIICSMYNHSNSRVCVVLCCVVLLCCVVSAHGIRAVGLCEQVACGRAHGTKHTRSSHTCTTYPPRITLSILPTASSATCTIVRIDVCAVCVYVYVCVCCVVLCRRMG